MRKARSPFSLRPPDDPSEPTGLRGSFAARSRIITTFVMLPRVEIVELVARAGFDAIIIDLEHGPMGVNDVVPLVGAARGAGIHAIARIARNSSVEIGQALDAGVDGILVPHVASVSDAEAVVAAARFPPDGDRSVNPYARGNGYDLGTGETTNSVNCRIGVIAMLEGAEAIENFDAIGSVPGIDGIFIGPVDFSSSLGLGGDPEHPRVVSAVKEALSRANDAGSYTGIYAPTPAAAARWLDAGANLVALSADIAMTMRSFAATRAALESERDMAGSVVGGLDGSAS